VSNQSINESIRFSIHQTIFKVSQSPTAFGHRVFGHRVSGHKSNQADRRPVKFLGTENQGIRFYRTEVFCGGWRKAPLVSFCCLRAAPCWSLHTRFLCVCVGVCSCVKLCSVLFGSQLSLSISSRHLFVLFVVVLSFRRPLH
jgi:hypothetical protein